MRFRRKGSDRKPELNLASMIDATFLLLSYFIFTSGAGSTLAIATASRSSLRVIHPSAPVATVATYGIAVYAPPKVTRPAVRP